MLPHLTTHDLVHTWHQLLQESMGSAGGGLAGGVHGCGGDGGAAGVPKRRAGGKGGGGGGGGGGEGGGAEGGVEGSGGEGGVSEGGAGGDAGGGRGGNIALLVTVSSPSSPAAAASTASCSSTWAAKLAARPSSVCPVCRTAVETISMATSALYSMETSDLTAPAATMASASMRGSARMVPSRLRSCRSSSSEYKYGHSGAPPPRLHSSPRPVHIARTRTALSCSPRILSMRKIVAARSVLSKGP